MTRPELGNSLVAPSQSISLSASAIYHSSKMRVRQSEAPVIISFRANSQLTQLKNRDPTANPFVDELSFSIRRI